MEKITDYIAKTIQNVASLIALAILLGAMLFATMIAEEAIGNVIPYLLTSIIFVLFLIFFKIENKK